MFKIFTRIVIGLAVVVGLFLGIVAMQPNDFRISRSATMAAPPADVFEQVNDFHKWNDWSPWAKLDPQAKNSLEGPTAGKGAIFKWDGNNDVGAGQMTITDSRPSESVKIKLEFTRPFVNACDVEFTFQPEKDKTLVTWRMAGQNNFVGKLMCMFMNMDKMVGGEYEKGLAAMKTIVEGEGKK